MFLGVNLSFFVVIVAMAGLRYLRAVTFNRVVTFNSGIWVMRGIRSIRGSRGIRDIKGISTKSIAEIRKVGGLC